MGIALGHLDALPFIYGVLIAMNAILLIWKLVSRRWFALIIDIGAFYGIFSMHSGSMSGALAALIAATILSIVVPMMLSMMRHRWSAAS